MATAPQEILTGAERAQVVELARGADDVALYPRVTALREAGLLIVTFEPDWVFVGAAQLVVEKLTVTLTESVDGETGAVKRRLTGRHTELCQGRGFERAALGQDSELQKDSAARRAAFEVVDQALKKHGQFGTHGNLSAGLAHLCTDHAVVVYEEPDIFSVVATPRTPLGGEPIFDFRVRKRDGAIDEVVVSAMPAPLPRPTPGHPVLGEGDDIKTQPLARQDDPSVEDEGGDEDDALETMDEE